MSESLHPSRRTLLKSAGLAAAACLTDPLQRFAARARSAEAPRGGEGFGPLEPINDANTGLPLLRLPAGFSYTTFGWQGEPLTEGGVTPPLHDGMTVLKQQGSLVTLCRNHEVDGAGPAIGPAENTYDPQAPAGCTNLLFDLSTRKLVRSWASLSGTSRNCAGGPTPWGTWITCEETVTGPGSKDKDGNILAFDRSHGWAFEVPADRAIAPQPIKAMGRFTHEAVAIDPRTGIVYQSEDTSSAGFYRYVPTTPGKLADGGRLQMMKLAEIADTRPVADPNRAFQVSWVDIPEPEAGLIEGDLQGFKPEQGVFRQGVAQGGAIFAGLEGAWFDEGRVLFTAKSGGPAKRGQIWQYNLTNETLQLVYVSQRRDDLNMPDNICGSPRGGLVVCEDGDEGDPPMRLHCLSRAGQLSPFCVNNIDFGDRPFRGFEGDFKDCEWAGATFSPDGSTLFVNIQRPGMTIAITGAWQPGLL